MGKASRAISLGISTLIVIVIILIVGSGVYLNATFNTASSSDFNSTDSSSGISSTVTTTYQICSRSTPPTGVVPCTSTISSNSGVQKETSSLVTCTAIGAISYMICPTTLRISAVGSPGATPFGCPSPCGSWNFTVTINSSSVVRGQTIELVANLTNIAPNQTINSWIVPYINPSVYSSNGTEVWAWYPPQHYENMTIASGETFSQDVSIPTSQLVSGQSYFIQVAPLSIQFPTPNNYTFTFEFSVR